MADQAQAVLTATVTVLHRSAAMPVTRACALVGVPRSSYYRLSRGYTHYRPVPDPIPQARRRQPAALSGAERAAIVEVLSADDHANLSVVQTYWRVFDAGTVACSQRTFYRVAAAAHLVGDRRRRRGGVGPARRRPVVRADAVGQLWSWDITELRGPRTQDRYLLYLVIDVFSRYPVAWCLEHRESAQRAVELFTTAITRHGAPTVLHADNGASMRSTVLLDALEAAGVLASFSRPRVSDDNPFSEALFKTVKYDLSCPARFDSIDHARQWTAQFLHRYATEHRHSGLGRHTPASVHHGTAAEVQAHRQRMLDRCWATHPERFHRRPTAPALPGPTGINIHLSQTG
ncbi:IS3 family transposase [Rhodococcus indonesiensis]